MNFRGLENGDYEVVENKEVLGQVFKVEDGKKWSWRIDGEDSEKVYSDRKTAGLAVVAEYEDADSADEPTALVPPSTLDDESDKEKDDDLGDLTEEDDDLSELDVESTPEIIEIPPTEEPIKIPLTAIPVVPDEEEERDGMDSDYPCALPEGLEQVYDDCTDSERAIFAELLDELIGLRENGPDIALLTRAEFFLCATYDNNISYTTLSNCWAAISGFSSTSRDFKRFARHASKGIGDLYHGIVLILEVNSPEVVVFSKGQDDRLAFMVDELKAKGKMKQVLDTINS